MARVRLGSILLTADPVEQKPNGNWLMRARQHTARTSPGTLIEIASKDVIEMAAAEMPGSAPQPEDLSIGPVPEEKIDWASLEKAMADERATLPTAAELIAQHRQNVAEGKTPPGPFQTPRSNPGHPPAAGDHR